MTNSKIIFTLYITILLTSTINAETNADNINTKPLNYHNKNMGDPVALNPEWYWAGLRSQISLGVLDSADFDSDSKIEILTSGGQGNLTQPPKKMFILESDMKTAICEANLGSFPFDYHIMQNDEDPALEVVFVTQSQVLIMDGKTCDIDIKHEFEQNITSAAIGDLNNDNVLDIAYSISNNLYTSPWNDFSNPSEKIDFGGPKVIINSLGRQGGEDIGVLSDDVIYILKGDDLEIIREIHGNLTQNFDFGDINGDGSYELVQVVISPSAVEVINIDSGNLLFKTFVANYVLMRLSDVNNDMVHEIIVGEDGFDGKISQLNEVGEIVHSVENPSGSFTNILMTDFNAGEGHEYIWGTGYGSTAVNKFYKANITTQSITQRSQDFEGPYRFSDMGDIFDNGYNYIGISHDKSGFDNGGISVININKGLVEPNLYTNYSVPGGTLSAVATANIDSDPSWEICFANGFGNSQYVITCKDSITEDTQTSITYRNGYIYQMDLIDLDNDSDKEIVVISKNGYINSYYSDNGFIHWQSEPFLNEEISWGFDGMKLIGDDLWVFFLSGNIYKIDPLNGSVLESFLNTSITNVSIKNGNIYAIKQGAGIGLLNLETMDIDDLIYPTTDLFDFIKVSEDERNILLGRKVSNDRYSPTLLSIDNTFSPINIDTLIYDAHLPNFLQLLLAGPNGAISYDLRIFYDEIFINSFE